MSLPQVSDGVIFISIIKHKIHEENDSLFYMSILQLFPLIVLPDAPRLFFHNFIYLRWTYFTESLWVCLLNTCFYFSSFMKDSFIKYRMHGWQFFSFCTWKMLCYLLRLHGFRWEILCNSDWCFPISNPSFLFGCFQSFSVFSFQEFNYDGFLRTKFSWTIGLFLIKLWNIYLLNNLPRKQRFCVIRIISCALYFPYQSLIT